MWGLSSHPEVVHITLDSRCCCAVMDDSDLPCAHRGYVEYGFQQGFKQIVSANELLWYSAYIPYASGPGLVQGTAQDTQCRQ